MQEKSEQTIDTGLFDIQALENGALDLVVAGGAGNSNCNCNSNTNSNSEPE